MHIVYSCVTGSRAYGLHREDSDYDIKRVYIQQPMVMFSVDDKSKTHTYKHIYKGIEADYVDYELRTFTKLAAKSNPTVLEMLWSPEIIVCADVFKANFIKHRKLFLTKHIITTYIGYSIQQMKRYEKDSKPKHIMHLMRLLLACEHALKTGEMLVDVSHQKDYLNALRDGDIGINREEMELKIEELEQIDTNLPQNRDFPAINDLIYEVYAHWFKIYLNAGDRTEKE